MFANARTTRTLSIGIVLLFLTTPTSAHVGWSDDFSYTNISEMNGCELGSLELEADSNLTNVTASNYS